MAIIDSEMTIATSGTRDMPMLMTEKDYFDAIGKKYAIEILSATAEPTTAVSLSNELGIPIATCYRRLNQLEGCGLVEVAGTTLSDKHQRCQQYKRTIDEINIKFED
jgi:predicted transcriptional regulator